MSSKTKAELLTEAQKAGLEVTEENTVAEIKTALEEHASNNSDDSQDQGDDSQDQETTDTAEPAEMFDAQNKTAEDAAKANEREQAEYQE